MKITQLKLDGLLLIEPPIYSDNRGFFVERFNAAEYEQKGLATRFLQDNHSRSFPGVLRGLHFQLDPPQGKLVSVIRGKIWDVCVDIRPSSPTFCQWISVELDSSKAAALWLPQGFAHGFCVLGDEPADILYKVDGLYNPKSEGGIHWADKQLGIDWPIKDPIVSERDQKLPALSDALRRIRG